MNLFLEFNMIYVCIGGLIGPLVACLYFKYLLEKKLENNEYLENYDPNEVKIYK